MVARRDAMTNLIIDADCQIHFMIRVAALEFFVYPLLLCEEHFITSMDANTDWK